MAATGLEAWFLESLTRIRVLIKGGKHPETVALALMRLHEYWPGSSSFLGHAKDTLVPPPAGEVVSVFTAVSVEAEVLSALLSVGSCGLLDALANVVICLVPQTSALELETEALAAMVDSGVVVSERLEASGPAANLSSGVPHTVRYDPIAAQLREITNSWPTSLKAELATVAELARDKHPRVTSAMAALGEAVTGMETTTCKAQEIGDESLALRSVGRLSHVLSLISWYSSLTRSALTAVVNPSTGMGSASGLYSSAGEIGTLRCAQAVVDEMAARVAPDLPLAVVSYGQSFSLADFSTSLEVALNGPLPERLPTVLSMPTYCVSRAGALPVLAHEMGHLVLSSEAGHHVRGQLAQLLVDEPIGAVTELAESFGNRKYGVDGAIASIAGSWAEELLADLLACRLTGPAYLFAVARFALGTIDSLDCSAHSHPPFGMRLGVIAKTLELSGFTPSFSTDYAVYDGGLAESVEAVALDADSLVPVPYTLDDHANALRDVAENLVLGQRCDDPPSMLLNALWDRVSRRDGYVNEIALFWSLLPNE